MADSPQVHRYLDASTCHLPTAERDHLTHMGIDGPRVIPHEYGWWINVQREVEDRNVPDWMDALRELLAYAAIHDCNWINLDQDADQVDALPSYQ